MFENIVIGLFGLLMVNYLVIIARQRIVKIVIGICKCQYKNVQF